MPYKDKSTGQWIAQVSETLPDGKKKKHCSRCKTRREALAWEDEKKKLVATGPVEQTPTVSLREWATAYLDFSKARHSKKTYEEKRFAFRAFFSSIDGQELSVDSISPKMVLAHLGAQASQRSGNGANKDRKNLRAAWQWGVAFMALPMPNPFDSVPRFAEDREERRVPTLDEFWEVYEVSGSNSDRCMLFAYLHTGARRDELFRLKWKDVDLPGKRVRLYTKKNEVGEWKEAWLPIGEELASMIERQRRVTGLLGFVFMRKEDGPGGKWIPYLYRQHWLKTLCERAGVRVFGFHGIRHLFASILASNPAVPLVEIQKMLRHGSIATTQRYIHSLQDGSREALAALPGLSRQDVPESNFGNKKQVSK